MKTEVVCIKSKNEVKRINYDKGYIVRCVDHMSGRVMFRGANKRISIIKDSNSERDIYTLSYAWKALNEFFLNKKGIKRIIIFYYNQKVYEDLVIALILISNLDHKMKKTNLYKSYTMQQLLDKLDFLECFEDESHKLRIGELLNKQVEIYEVFGVALPTSSC